MTGRKGNKKPFRFLEKSACATHKIYCLLMSFKQASAELDALRAEFVSLQTEAERIAFDAKMQSYFDSKSEEDKQVVSRAFLQLLDDSAARLEESLTQILQLKKQGKWDEPVHLPEFLEKHPQFS